MGKPRRLNPASLLLKIILLAAVLIAVMILSLSVGSVNISIGEIFSSFGGRGNNEMVSRILFDIRLPRVLLAVAVGGGLSIAGAVFQSLLMNPLAEPYILGISSGGTFGAVLSFLIGISFFGTQLFAFAGAACVMLIVFVLGRRYGELEPNVLLLTGVMVGAFFSAAILLMMTLLNDSLRTAVFWLIGNLSLADSDSVKFVMPVTIVVAIFLTINSNKYNVLSLGTEMARQMGINTSLLKNLSYILSSLMIGSIVSVSGIVGFVGLLVPHVCRMIFGVDNRIVIPASFFLGAAYLVMADTISRTIIAPSELPVGAVTALIGAPFFIFLLRKRFKMIA